MSSFIAFAVKVFPRRYYKIGAAREMCGSRKVDAKALLNDKLLKMNAMMAAGEELPSGEEGELEDGQCLVQFNATSLAVLEDVGEVTARLLRIGDTSKEVSKSNQTETEKQH